MEIFDACSMWQNFFSNLPAVVQINLKRKVYHVRDNSLLVVWSDDFPAGGYQALLQEIGAALLYGDRSVFREKLTPRAIERREPFYFDVSTFSTSTESRKVRIQVVFGLGAGKDVMELRIAPMQASTNDQAVN